MQSAIFPQRSVRTWGQVVDVALYEAVFAMMESMLPEFDAFRAVRERTGSILPGIAPTSAYACADGSHVLIVANGDSIFQRLCRAMGRDDLADDPSLAHNDGRAAPAYLRQLRARVASS